MLERDGRKLYIAKDILSDDFEITVISNTFTYFLPNSHDFNVPQFAIHEDGSVHIILYYGNKKVWSEESKKATKLYFSSHLSSLIIETDKESI